MTPQHTLAEATDLLGRTLLASLFVIEGWNKVQAYAPSFTYMEKFGVPGQLLPLVIALEIGAGLMLVLGWKTRWAGLALAIFCVATALMFHWKPGDRAQLLQLEKNLALAGALLLFAARGAGAWALDSRRRST
jgi:putative oxidoreductase